LEEIDKTADATTESECLTELENIRQELSDEKDKSEKYLANWQKSQAEFDNYKKWVVVDKNDTIKFANSALIKELLPVLDDMTMALNATPQKGSYVDWIKGVKLIYHKLIALLGTQDLKEIEAKGQAFDPKKHEAVMCKEGQEGIVIEVVRKGYILKNTVLRPSLVIVGRGKEEKEEQHEQSDRN
jgi:molecular chaperone GrpE